MPDSKQHRVCEAGKRASHLPCHASSHNRSIGPSFQHQHTAPVHAPFPPLPGDALVRALLGLSADSSTN